MTKQLLELAHCEQNMYDIYVCQDENDILWSDKEHKNVHEIEGKEHRSYAAADQSRQNPERPKDGAPTQLGLVERIYRHTKKREQSDDPATNNYCKSSVDPLNRLANRYLDRTPNDTGIFQQGTQQHKKDLRQKGSIISEDIRQI